MARKRTDPLMTPEEARVWYDARAALERSAVEVARREAEAFLRAQGVIRDGMTIRERLQAMHAYREQLRVSPGVSARAPLALEWVEVPF